MVELLVVIAMIAILAILVVPAVDEPDARMEQLRVEGNVEALASEAQSKDIKRARHAVETLGHVGRDSIQKLRTTMTDSRPEIRQEAVIAYEKVMAASPKDFNPAVLSQIARTDENKDVRITAITALGNMGAYEELETLLQAMNDDDLTVRRRAAQAVVLIIRRRYTFDANASPRQRLKEIDRIRRFWKFYQDNVTKFHNDKRKKQANQN
jgi:HEAT repeat protein